MTTDELKGFLEDRVPFVIKCHTDRMPKECERVAAVIRGSMFPVVRESCRPPSEEVPGYPSFPSPPSRPDIYDRSLQEVQPSCIPRQFTFLYRAFHELAPRRRMPKGENLETMIGRSGERQDRLFER